MVKRLLTAVLILPGMVLVVIPLALLYFFKDSAFGHSITSLLQFQFWAALALGFLGLCLAVWTVSLFVRFGEGTPAPWDPPKKFVVRGPYRHVRNPMILAVFLMLFSEAIFFQSWPLFGWFIAFKLANAIYIPCIEEKKLKGRFGADYQEYMRNVRRWIPKIKAYKIP